MISPLVCADPCESALGIVFLMIQLLLILAVYGFIIFRLYLDERRRRQLDRIQEQQFREYMKRSF